MIQELDLLALYMFEEIALVNEFYTCFIILMRFHDGPVLRFKEKKL